ncbi:HEAT repeat domain-containing protein [Prochlorococcus sp. MIT 1341]|uniref:HEAT repeat domain-containing protein n=1 Tax=Prochlorococcus sp. MIT 1341 TaxID=3096221 RepID=UPI002A74F91F|nr:HEAT repeat domain-containing protein [Prochlorococcus sp. MIT 1341]
MNQIFAGSAAFLVVLVMWSLGRRPNQKIFGNTVASQIVDMNRTQISLMNSPKGKKSIDFLSQKASEDVFEAPQTARERAQLQRQLQQLMNKGPEERLKAIQICTKWGHKSVLPFLRRGLKDSDPHVVFAAANAIKEQKNNIPLIQEKVLPRNVSLMR